jgi:hypothetical protein
LNQVSKWLVGKWDVGKVLHRETKLGQADGIQLTTGKTIYPVLLVVDCQCLNKLKENAHRLVEYADGAVMEKISNFSETSDSENGMTKARHEARLRRALDIGDEIGTKDSCRSQGNNPVKTHVSVRKRRAVFRCIMRACVLHSFFYFFHPYGNCRRRRKKR